jgi:prolyl-tRNA editing enzyme YbaK/EbsC (Cys-tRNA(Pro) deacylase)
MLARPVAAPDRYRRPGDCEERCRRLRAVPEPRDHPAIQRVLDAAARKGVSLDIRVFDESTHTAEEAAATVGAELGQIVKSLVFVAPADDGSLEPLICLVSGPNRVDLGRLAAVVGDRDVRRSTAREAQELTGFVIGGIPPFGHARAVRTVMDPDLTGYPVVWAAAGTPTAVFPVPPGTLRILANATVAPITEERAPLEPVGPGKASPDTTGDAQTPPVASTPTNAGV